MSAIQIADFQYFPESFESDSGAERSLNFKRARQVYIASSLIFPNRLVANSRLSLIRKLGWLLVLFQVLDGALTAVGIHIFGSEMEGNPLLRQIIEVLGPGIGIAMVKSAAIIITFSICMYGSRVAWLTKALKAMCCVYFTFALLPWSLILASYYGAFLGVL